MEGTDGLSLTCHIRTVEACRELTAAIAALACRETCFELPQPAAAGAQPPFHAPVDYRLLTPPRATRVLLLAHTPCSADWAMLVRRPGAFLVFELHRENAQRAAPRVV